jgi:uncharacterized protein DUF1566
VQNRDSKRVLSVLLGVAALASALGIVVAVRAAAPAGRYTIANGTVYDTKTRLNWQQASSSSKYSQTDAVTYCSNLGLNGATWRLPTMKELITLADLSVAPPGPTIDTTAFPNTPAAYFWSSTLYNGTPGEAWSVLFIYGFSYGNTVTDLNFVRCVR